MAFALDRILEFKPRLDVFALKRAGALFDGAVTRWRFGDGLELRTAFQSPWLTVALVSARQEIEVTWYSSPIPWIERPSLICPRCSSGRYCLFEVGGTFMCRGKACGNLEHAVRHIGRHTPQLARLARLRRKLGASEAPFSELPPLTSLRPKQRRIVGEILLLEQGVLASIGSVADSLEARARDGRLIRNGRS